MLFSVSEFSKLKFNIVSVSVWGPDVEGGSRLRLCHSLRQLALVMDELPDHSSKFEEALRVLPEEAHGEPFDLSGETAKHLSQTLALFRQSAKVPYTPLVANLSMFAGPCKEGEPAIIFWTDPEGEAHGALTYTRLSTIGALNSMEWMSKTERARHIATMNKWDCLPLGSYAAVKWIEGENATFFHKAALLAKQFYLEHQH